VSTKPGTAHTAKIISAVIDDEKVKRAGTLLKPQHVIVDFAPNRISTSRINTLTADGRIQSPIWTFDHTRWAEVYGRQKRTGYVFAPRTFAMLVSLASRIVFLRRFGAVIGKNGARIAKTMGMVPDSWIDAVMAANLIQSDTASLLKEETVRRCHVRGADLVIPSSITNIEPTFADDLAFELRELMPQGISAREKGALVNTLNGLISYVDYVANEGALAFDSSSRLEDQLQADALRALRMQKVDVAEGSNFAGGATDLVIDKLIVVENKVADAGANPWTTKPAASLQARRYSIPIGTRVVVTLVAYSPSSEDALLRPHQSFRATKVAGVSDDTVELRVLVPYNMSKPSSARPPKTK
jgi:hypothetical protein